MRHDTRHITHMIFMIHGTRHDMLCIRYVMKRRKKRNEAHFQITSLLTFGISIRLKTRAEGDTTRPWSLTFRKEHSFRKCWWQTGVPLNVTVTQIFCGVAVIVVGLCVVWFDDFICRYHLHIEKQCNGFKKVLGFMILGFSQLSCSNCVMCIAASSTITIPVRIVAMPTTHIASANIREESPEVAEIVINIALNIQRTRIEQMHLAYL